MPPLLQNIKKMSEIFGLRHSYCTAFVPSLSLFLIGIVLKHLGIYIKHNIFRYI